MKDIYLIRHSKINANAISVDDPVMCGSTQAHLIKDGKELARKIANERFASDKDFERALNHVQCIFVSDLIRTNETAEAMFPCYKFVAKTHRLAYGMKTTFHLTLT